MPTKRQEQAIYLYARLMEEVKGRTGAIEQAMKADWGINGPYVQEFCFLQLRMLCELVALGCLVAHGDIEGAQSRFLRKEYSAEKIFARLEELHPDFFPHPHRQVRLAPNRVHLHPVTDRFLTKAEMLKLYGRCGDYLHRGNFKSILTSTDPPPPVFDEIDESVRKLARLLMVHRLALLDGETAMVCLMQVKDQNNRVQVAIIEAREPPSLS